MLVMNPVGIFLDYYWWFVVIYSLNCFAHFIADTVFNDVTAQYKVTPLKRDVIMILYRKYLKKVLINIILQPIPFGLVSVYFIDLGDLYTTEFSFLRCICELFAMAVVTDILFYSIHRLFHTRFLYKYHKVHHEVTIPIALATLYVGEIDMLFSNTIPMIIHSFFIASNHITVKIWFALILTESIWSHAGYRIGSTYHDLHHRRGTVNYGNLLFMDRLFGTYRR